MGLMDMSHQEVSGCEQNGVYGLSQSYMYSADYNGRTSDIWPGKQVKCPVIFNITLTECPGSFFLL